MSIFFVLGILAIIWAAGSLLAEWMIRNKHDEDYASGFLRSGGCGFTFMIVFSALSIFAMKYLDWGLIVCVIWAIAMYAIFYTTVMLKIKTNKRE